MANVKNAVAFCLVSRSNIYTPPGCCSAMFKYSLYSLDGVGANRCKNALMHLVIHSYAMVKQLQIDHMATCSAAGHPSCHDVRQNSRSWLFFAAGQAGYGCLWL